MNCSRCEKQLHPTDTRQTSFSDDVLCEACAKGAEKPIVQRLNDAGYVVLMAEIPSGNLKAVMLYHFTAAPHPPRDLFLHLDHEIAFSKSDLGREVGIMPVVRTQAKTMDEALRLAELEAQREERKRDIMVRFDDVEVEIRREGWR